MLPERGQGRVAPRVARVIVWDANILVGYLDDTDSHHEGIVQFVEEHFAEGFATSVLTLAEALVHPAKAQLEDRSETALRRIGLRVLGLEATDGAALARVRSSYDLRMPDAVVLHAAMTTGSKIATTDRGLAAQAARAGVSVVSVR